MNDIDWDEPSGSLYGLGAELGAEPTTGCGDLCQRSRLEPQRRHLLLRRELPLRDLRLRLRNLRGRPSDRRVFATVDQSSGAFPDGLTVTPRGVWSSKTAPAEWFATPRTAASRTRSTCRFPADELSRRADLDVLYITTSRQNLTPEQLRRYPLSGSVFAVRPGVSGLPEPSSPVASESRRSRGVIACTGRASSHGRAGAPTYAAPIDAEA